MGNWKSGPGWGVGRQEAAGSSARELLEAHAHITVLPGFSPQSTAEGSGLKVRERTMTVPQGTVMAYRTVGLWDDGGTVTGMPPAPGSASCFFPHPFSPFTAIQCPGAASDQAPPPTPALAPAQ